MLALLWIGFIANVAIASMNAVILYEGHSQGWLGIINLIAAICLGVVISKESKTC